MKTKTIWLTLAFVTTCLLVNGCGRGRKKPAKAWTPPARTQPSQVSDGPNVVSRTYPCGSCGILRLDKRMPEQVQLNDPFQYTITVTNETVAEVEQIVVREQIAENFKVLGTSPQGRSTNGHVVWELGSILPDSSKQITVEGVATAADPVRQCATMTYVLPACAQTNVVEPRLVLAKVLPEEALLCDTIPLKLRVTNAGSGAARNVVIQDDLPTGMRTADGVTNLRINAGTLAPGQSKEFTANLEATRVGRYENQATASAAGGLTAKSAPTLIIVRLPALTIVKSGPETRYLGRPVKYTITIANTGTAPAQNIVLEDMVPAGMTFVSANHRGTLSNGKVVWSLPVLPPRESHLVEVTYQTDKEGTYTNRAVVKATCVDPVSASARTSVRGIAAVLLEVIDIDDPIELGSYETYMITTTNQGTSDSTNIRIVCTLEDNVEYGSAGGPTTATLQGQTVTFAPLPRLAPGAKATWKVVVKAIKPGDVRFKVAMNTDQLRRPVEETESTEMYE